MNSQNSKFNELDSTTIDAFIEWTVDAIDYVQMSKEAKQVIDALIEHSKQLLAAEIQLKQDVREYWMLGKQKHS